MSVPDETGRCRCDFRTKMVGDGCEHCNPAMARDFAYERIAGLEAENERLTEALGRIAGTTMSMVANESHGLARCKEIAARALDAHPTQTEDETDEHG